MRQGEKPLWLVMRITIDIAGISPKTSSKYARSRKYSSVRMSNARTPCCRCMNSSKTGHMYESKSFGFLGPGIVPRSILLLEWNRFWGGRLYSKKVRCQAVAFRRLNGQKPSVDSPSAISRGSEKYV